MLYPVQLIDEDNDGHVTVLFPDVPEAVTHGKTKKEALRRGVDALESAFEFYLEDGRPIPLPSALKRGAASVEISPSVAATILLYNEMLRQKVRPAELARRLGVKPQEMTRILDIRHSTKIDTIAEALGHLDKRLLLKVA